MSYLTYGLCLLLACLPVAGRAQAPAACAAPDPNFHIYLLMGQSNMAGRGPMTPELAAVGNARVFMLTAAGEWVPAKNPVHFDKPQAVGVGPGLSFGVAMAEAEPAVKIGLVPCAVGGTAIRSWQPGAYDEATNTHPYDDAVLRIQHAMRCGVVRGMLWHQGESDSNPAAAAAYLPKLAELIGRVRTLVGQPALPVVAGELGRFKENSIKFNAQLLRLPAAVPHTAVVTSENLVDKDDQNPFRRGLGRRAGPPLRGANAGVASRRSRRQKRRRKHPEAQNQTQKLTADEEVVDAPDRRRRRGAGRPSRAG